MHASRLRNSPTNIDHVVQIITSNGETSVKTLLTGKAYTPSYATDVNATIRREQKRLRNITTYADRSTRMTLSSSDKPR